MKDNNKFDKSSMITPLKGTKIRLNVISGSSVIQSTASRSSKLSTRRRRASAKFPSRERRRNQIWEILLKTPEILQQLLRFRIQRILRSDLIWYLRVETSDLVIMCCFV